MQNLKAPPPNVIEPSKRYSVTVHTSRGDFVIALVEPKVAPQTVNNFVWLAQNHYYDGLTFHRVVAGFVVQGGDPLGNGTGGPGYEFGDEFHPDLRFDRPYLLAMANAGPGTNGSQFFITVAPTPHLNRKHTIFGEVADQESRNVVDAIGRTQTAPGDRPAQDIVIDKITIEPV